jgi:phosphomannomutase/phosphoglucomutase
MVAPRREDARHKAAEGDSPPGIKRFWIESFIGIALVLLPTALLLLYVWAARSAADSRLLLEGATDALAVTVASEMTRVRGVVQAWQEDPQLRAAFAAPGKPETLKQREEDLRKRLPEALNIHLFAPEQIHAVEGIPFMSYAGLDLARQAAQARTLTLIEVHKVGQPDMHLAVAAPVLDAAHERVLGVVHVALPMNLLPNPLGSTGDSGLILYQQVVGDAVANLERIDAPDGPPDHTAAIAGTRLRTAVWIKGAALVDPWLMGGVGAGFLVVMALIGAVLWLGYSGLRRALLLDCKGFVALVDDAVHQRTVRRIKTRLADIQEAHQETLNLLRVLQPTRAPLRGTAAAPAPRAPAVPDAEGDGLNPTSTLSESSIEVEELDLSVYDLDLPVEALNLPEGFDPYATPIEQTPEGAPSLQEALDAGIASYGTTQADVPAEIFRAYDIRGLVDDQLTAPVIRAIGQAVGSAAAALGDPTVVVGRDVRPSSAALGDALIQGIRGTGANVLDLGVVPTPLVYFACAHPQPQTGAMVTASHNPITYNGVKIVLNGESAQADQIQALYRRILVGDLVSGRGGYQAQDIIRSYRAYLEEDVNLARGLTVAIDCGNGTLSAVAPALLRALGCQVLELNCDLESPLPDPIPDPALPECTRDLGELVLSKGADIGLAFDVDGDRLGVVDSQGRYISADRVLMLLATDVLARHPGTDIIYDVKCSRHLAEVIRQASGRPVMWRSGHAPIKTKVRESGALLAGELTGHLYFKERWFGFDDALYAGARLLEVLSLDPRSTTEIFAALPGGLTTPELAMPLAEGEPERIMRAVLRLADRLDGVEVIRIDGLRAEFDRGFGVVRASNTLPQLTFRFEGDDAQALEKIQSLFRRLMEKAAPGLPLPF